MDTAIVLLRNVNFEKARKPAESTARKTDSTVERLGQYFVW